MSTIPPTDDAVRRLYAGHPLVAEVVTALHVLGCVTRQQAEALLGAADVHLTDRERRAVLLRFDEPARAFPYDAASDRVLRLVDELEPADDSVEARQLRETAGSVRDHRQAREAEARRAAGDWRDVGLGMQERRAHTGEVCTCGRPALVVYRTSEGHEVGYCGIPNGGAR